MPNPTPLSTEEFLKQYNTQSSAPAAGGSSAKPLSVDEFARQFSAQSGTQAPSQPAPEAQNTPWRIDSSPNDGAIVTGLKTAVNAVPDVWSFAKNVVRSTVELPKNVFYDIPKEVAGLVNDAGGIGGAAKEFVKAIPEGADTGTEAFQRPFKALVGGGIDLATDKLTGGNGTHILSDATVEDLKKKFTEHPIESTAPAVLLARGLAGGVDAITRSAAEGKMSDYVSNLEQNVRAGKPIPRSTGTNLGAAFDEGVSRVGSMVTKPVKTVFGKATEAAVPPETSAEVAGRVLQGDIRSQPVGARVLSQIDTSKVKTYSDLSRVLDENVKQNLKSVDAEFAKATEPVKLKDLKQTVEADAGGSVVSAKINYVEEALNHLLEVAKKTRDVAEEARMKTIIKRAKEQGLTPTEINKIAREYGTEFGKKAFDKMGTPLTSVNARAYENIRKGVKETARSFLKTDEAKAFDKSTHEILDVKILVDKVNEAVNRLEQRVVKRNLMEKIGRAIGTGVDLATFGGLRAFLARLFPSNIGLKVQNNMDFEAALSKNLETIKKLEGADDTTLVNTIVKRLKEVNQLPERIGTPYAPTNFGRSEAYTETPRQ